MCTNEFSKIPLNPPSPRKKTHIYAVVNNIRENDIPAGTYRRQRRRRRRREAKKKKIISQTRAKPVCRATVNFCNGKRGGGCYNPANLTHRRSD